MIYIISPSVSPEELSPNPPHLESSLAFLSTGCLLHVPNPSLWRCPPLSNLIDLAVKSPAMPYALLWLFQYPLEYDLSYFGCKGNKKKRFPMHKVCFFILLHHYPTNNRANYPKFAAFLSWVLLICWFYYWLLLCFLLRSYAPIYVQCRNQSRWNCKYVHRGLTITQREKGDWTCHNNW